MKVLKDRVLVVVKEVAETIKTEGGLTIPAGTQENGDIDEAVVVSVGEGIANLAENDRVYLYKGAGKEFKVEGQAYRTVSPADIIVVL